MKLYNTLTRQKEEFVPITPGEVKMYSCGPTVYNYFHVGNARPFIIFDLLRRYFEYRGYKVEFVQNFTDIDDKVINKANEEGVDFNTIAERYIKEYFVDAQGLGVKKATVHPRATETMDAIIDIVERLIENGHAYVAENGDVYFRTKSFPEYGKLCHQPMEELQAGGAYDGVEVHGQPPGWPEVLAVFAARTAGAEDGVDVAVLDPERVERLRTVFWDMTKLTTQVETIEHTGTGEDSGWTESILHITITPRTPDDMRVFYQFTDDQNEALDELLENRDLLAALAGDLTISDPDAKALLAALPEDLSPERRAVVETACSLVGKVNYFWGGKSLVLGWDERWGTIQKVTAAGSSTTGTYRPYGMDCSGFVDWVFYNVTGGEYIIGHGGGATMQHNYCTEISWDEALPGDLVFYPGDEHVGIVGGRDGNGELLIVHCAFSQDNVVITSLQGFTFIGRPLYYVK